MNLLNFERALVIGAHTDDEFGCAGAIMRLLASEVDVYYAVFSICEESVPAGFPKDILGREVREAAKVMGLKDDHLKVYNYRVRHFPSFRQEILEEFINLRKEIKPDLVLVPALSDTHQDHQVVSMEGFRAFKYASIFGYELPMNTITFHHVCFVEFDEAILNRKIAVTECYASQQFRPYMKADFIRGLAKMRGVQAGKQFAEAFEVLRLNL